MGCKAAYPKLRDEDVEAVYLTYHKYFKAAQHNPDAPEPTSTRNHRSILLDALWGPLLTREDMEADDFLVEEKLKLPSGHLIQSLEQAYGWSFKRLHQSAVFYRKEMYGYLNYLWEQGL